MLKRFSKKFREDTNTGFGSLSDNQGTRLINSDGSFNVTRSGLPFKYRFNHYHDLITMKWWKFNLFVVTAYLIINILFALAYLLVGMDEIQGDTGISVTEQFWDAFFFSSQTLTTVGYGRENPIGFHANLVSAFECLVGLMCFALITGLLYGRFSRPRALLLYSKKGIIAPYQNTSAFMFRIVNARQNQLVECEAQLLMSFNAVEGGRELRRFFPLKLERDKVTGLAMSWTIVHPINEESPLFGWGERDYKDAGVEMLFIFKAFDDTYSQTVHTRYSYRWSEIEWGVKFIPMYHRSKDGTGTVLELDKIGLYEPANLPAGSNPSPIPQQVSQE